MLDMKQAFDTVFEQGKALHDRKFSQPRTTKTVSIDEIEVGDVIAEDISAKDDLPPFHASVMDGYALSTSQDATSQSFKILESLRSVAGTEPNAAIGQAEGTDRVAVYITTGAPVPKGFTTVVPIEQIHKEAQERVIVKQGVTVKEGQFIR